MMIWENEIRISAGGEKKYENDSSFFDDDESFHRYCLYLFDSTFYRTDCGASYFEEKGMFHDAVETTMPATNGCLRSSFRNLIFQREY